MTDYQQTTSAAAARLIPEDLSYLIEDRPLLWCESAEEYDALFGQIYAEMDPKGVIETLLVKDLVDYFWEIRRMRGLRVAALHAELPVAASELLMPTYADVLRQKNAVDVKPLIFGAVDGLKIQRDALTKMMSEAHVTPQMMQYEALKSGLHVMSAIDTSIARLERRRDQLLKQIAERRQAFKAMAKGLIERDEAQVIDASPGRVH